MRILITGCAGFIGNSFARLLLQKGHTITGIDNFLLGSKGSISDILKHPRFKFIKADLLEPKKINGHFQKQELVIHLAANSDIKKSLKERDLDLKLNLLTTFNVLEAMRKNNVKKIIFSSSSTIYGIPNTAPTKEGDGPFLPISLYGATKLACEGMIAAFSHLFHIQGWIFRLGNVVGKRLTHGVIYDFIKKLKKNDRLLKVLGNGQQKKSYFYLEDCLEGVWFGFNKSRKKMNLFNLSSPDNMRVKEIAELTVKHFGSKHTKISFQKQKEGWKGDVTEVFLSVNKIKKLGWKAKYKSRQAVEMCLNDLCK
ncbi:MAG: GDP-mannose 4,6-dehydratase [Elusimicrobia bacterium]|nr:GDP-mannose 4,6-dehydratase [Elusimicrobiota bacterium]